MKVPGHGHRAGGIARRAGAGEAHEHFRARIGVHADRLAGRERRLGSEAEDLREHTLLVRDERVELQHAVDAGAEAEQHLLAVRHAEKRGHVLDHQSLAGGYVHGDALVRLAGGQREEAGRVKGLARRMVRIARGHGRGVDHAHVLRGRAAGAGLRADDDSGGEHEQRERGNPRTVDAGHQALLDRLVAEWSSTRTIRRHRVPSKDFPNGSTRLYTLMDGAGRTGRHDMAVEVAAARRLFTREEYHRMGEVGILTRSDRVELIRGEIITKSPQGRRHRAFIDNLTQLLGQRLAGRAIVSVQMPIVLATDTEPEPDVQVLRRRAVPTSWCSARSSRSGHAAARGTTTSAITLHRRHATHTARAVWRVRRPTVRAL
jgi:hypothetical protein